MWSAVERLRQPLFEYTSGLDGIQLGLTIESLTIEWHSRGTTEPIT